MLCQNARLGQRLCLSELFPTVSTIRCPRPPPRSIAVSRLHTCIGADSLILILYSEIAEARTRIFNADGSEDGMCGNGIRCIGKYLYDSELCRRQEICIETNIGVRKLRIQVENGTATGVRVDMSQPRFAAQGCCPCTRKTSLPWRWRPLAVPGNSSA